MKKSPFQSAINAWPEDEAIAVFDMFPSLYEDEGPEYAENELVHDCARFKKIFARETDSEELFSRFMVKINELKDNYLSAKA